MGRKKQIFESDESEWEKGKAADELVEIDLESGMGGESSSPDEETFRRKKPQPMKPGTVFLIFLGMAVLAAVISAVLWYSGQG